MSNKIIKQNPVIQEKEVHWKAKCLYMLAGIAVAYGLAFLMLGKNDGVIFMQWHITIPLFSVYSGRNRSGISPDSLSHYHTQNLHMIMFT